MLRSIISIVVATLLAGLSCGHLVSVAHAQIPSTRGVYFLKKADSLFYISKPTSASDSQAIYWYKEGIEWHKRNKESNRQYLEAFQKIGNLYEMSRRYDEALNSYRQSIAVKRNVDDIHDSLFFTDYLYIGDIYHLRERYDSAELFYEKAEKLRNRYNIVNEIDRLLNSLGHLYYILGNYQKSINYYRKALAVQSREDYGFDQNRIRYSINIALASEKINKYGEAISLYRELLNNNIDLPIIHQNLGYAYFSTLQYDSARLYLSKSLHSEHLPTRLSAHITLARVYLATDLFDSAKYYFNRSIAINRRKVADRNVRLAEAYSGLAQLHQTQSDLDSALHYYQRALINTTFDFSDSTVTNNPTDVTQAISLLHLFDVLRGKAGAWHTYYEQDQDIVKLTHALATYQLAIRVARHIQKTYDNDEAKLFLVNKVAPVYEEAIATAVKLHERTKDPQYVTQAFQFSENSKASVLAESLRDVKIKASGNVNDSLLQEERRVKQQITALRLKLIESQDSAQNEACRQQLNDQEIRLARVVKRLQQDEHYYRRKYQPDTLKVADLQRSLLRSDEVLLEYFMGQQSVYLFLMTQGDLRVVPVRRTAELDSAWQRTRRQLYEYQPGQGDDPTSLATLYRYLLAPVAKAIADASHLTIIPDGPLHHLPFGLLSADDRGAGSLLRTHTMHYGYSAFLLQQAMEQRQRFPTETVLAMAPFAGQTDDGAVRQQGFSVLRDSQTEVERVGGSIYTEGKATKQQFLKVAGSHNVLHLATHASVDSENPSQSFIAFYPKERDSLANYRLYTHELYNMRLDSVKLVVLSACEAGNGQLVQGEGVMSLARAFAYAGCPNTVTTLWKADDRSSAYLTARMHHYLKEGWAKDEALRQAKLDYLDDEQVLPSQKAPYYWAHFVFIGDPAPIYDQDRLGWWIGMGLLVLVIAGLLMTRKRRKVRAMA